MNNMHEHRAVPILVAREDPGDLALLARVIDNVTASASKVRRVNLRGASASA